MGSGIATALILSNYPVILKEVNEKFLKGGMDRVKGICFFSFSLYYFDHTVFFYKCNMLNFATYIFSQSAKSCQERDNDSREA